MPKRLLYAKGSFVATLIVLNLCCFFAPTRAASAPTPLAIALDYSFFVGDLDSNYRPVTRVNGYVRSASVAKCYVSIRGLANELEGVYLSRFYGPDGRLVDETTYRIQLFAGGSSALTFSTRKISIVPNNIGIWRLELYLGTDLMFVEYFSVGDYLFDVSVTGFRSDLATKVLIDGKEAGSIRSGEKKTSAVPYGTHTISVSAVVGSTSDIRYECVQNSLNIRTEGSHTFEYSTLASRLSIAVICLEFPDFPHITSLDEIRKKAIDDVDRFYKEVSYGMLSITGEVFGWYQMPSPLRSYVADLSGRVVQWANQQDRVRLAYDALSVVRNNLVKTELYANTILVFSGPPIGFAVPELRVNCQSETVAWDVFAHELGHLLGLPDLYSYAVMSTKGQGAFVSTFVGIWDIMSISSSGTMCAWSRISLGWVKQNQVLTVGWNTWNVSATISPLELGLGTLVVKIETTNKRQYYLAEVQQEVKRSGLTRLGGVLITYIDETKKGGEDIVKVIDAHPDSSSNIQYELFDATFGLWENRNPVYLDSSGSFAVVLLQKTEQNYVITVTTAQVGKEALNAHKAVLLANSTIQKAQSEPRLGGFEQAKARLREAVQEYGNGKFGDSTRIAEDARTLAEKSLRALTESYLQLGICVAVSIVVVVLAIVYSRRRKKNVRPDGASERELAHASAPTLYLNVEGFQCHKKPKTHVWRPAACVS